MTDIPESESLLPFLTAPMKTGSPSSEPVVSVGPSKIRPDCSTVTLMVTVGAGVDVGVGAGVGVDVGNGVGVVVGVGSASWVTPWEAVATGLRSGVRILMAVGVCSKVGVLRIMAVGVGSKVGVLRIIEVDVASCAQATTSHVEMAIP